MIEIPHIGSFDLGIRFLVTPRVPIEGFVVGQRYNILIVNSLSKILKYQWSIVRPPGITESHGGSPEVVQTGETQTIVFTPTEVGDSYLIYAFAREVSTGRHQSISLRRPAFSNTHGRNYFISITLVIVISVILILVISVMAGLQFVRPKLRDFRPRINR